MNYVQLVNYLWIKVTLPVPLLGAVEGKVNIFLV